MTGKKWKWKNKDGAHGGLLYDSGNWGDVLKMLWLAEIVTWKERSGCKVDYFDPFAGDVHYPMGKKIASRIRQARLDQLDFLENAFLGKNFWPSAASGARMLATGRVVVWDADPGRRDNWLRSGAEVAENTASGWDMLAAAKPDPQAFLLVDPYDFLAEWREQLACVAEKSATVSILLYLYNRSGKNKDAFADYRKFRAVLDDAMGDRPKCIGRIAADSFLPDAHHELVFLPCGEDVARPGFDALVERLGDSALRLNAAQARCGIIDF